MLICMYNSYYSSSMLHISYKHIILFIDFAQCLENLGGESHFAIQTHDLIYNIIQVHNTLLYRCFVRLLPTRVLPVSVFDF